jgi:predicted site-specific integrase-resolvase
MEAEWHIETAGGVQHLPQKALARRWGVSTRSLERWRVRGIGPVYLKLNGRVIYRLQDVEAFEAACRRASTSGGAEPA